jgi:hypothetical protein
VLENEPVSTGSEAADRYIAEGYDGVIGMSSKLAAIVCCRLLQMQKAFGVQGHVGEIGAFEGRFLIALAHALAPGEMALGMDHFQWPDAGVEARFEANCSRHGIGPDRRITWKVDVATLRPEALLARLPGEGEARKLRLLHIDGDHATTSLAHDLELGAAVMQPGGLLVLDDMLHPGYPLLMSVVQDFMRRRPEWVPLCLIDRESIFAATKLVLCRRDWFERYEAAMLEPFKAITWPMGATFEPHWCLVLSRDTRLAAIG